VGMNAKIKKIIALGTGAVIASVGAAVVIVSTSNNKNLSMRHAKAAPMELVTSRASGLADDDLTCFDGGKDMVAFDYKITLTNNKEQYIHNNGSKLVLKNRNDIKKIEVTNTKLTSLEIVGCDSLHDVFAGNNQISDIHIEGCHQLYELDLNHNALSLLKINGLSNLHNLHID
jgi:Leucine-rich repeat (LRR) protein